MVLHALLLPLALLDALLLPVRALLYTVPISAVKGAHCLSCTALPFCLPTCPCCAALKRVLEHAQEQHGLTIQLGYGESYRAV